MDTIILSFLYKNRVFHVLESGKVITNSGKRLDDMKAEVKGGIGGGGEFGYMVRVFDGDNEIAYKATLA